MSWKFNPFTGKLDFFRRAIRSMIAAPTSPHEGEMYENALDDTVYIYYGGTWQVLHVLTPADSLTLEDTDLLLQESGFKLYLES